MSAKEDDSILNEGIFYSYDGNGWKDLYKIKYNPDNPNQFDIDPLTDQSVRKTYDINFFLQMLNNTIYFDPFRRLVVSYQDKKNVEYLIDVIFNFYSNCQACGIRKINPIPSNASKMLSKLLQKKRIRSPAD
jgi:hypothetical protein